MDSRAADQIARVVAASRGRDRVLDAVKAGALLVVVVGHSLAWHVGASGGAGNVLDTDRRPVALTWVFQVLPLFFAAGAVSNLSSLRRRGPQDYLRARTERPLTPVPVYAAVWAVVLLPLTPFVPLAGAAGVFLAQLLWFAGVYLIVSAAAVWTARWKARPAPTLGLWAIAIVLVDVLRLSGAPEALGWANLLLVWGFLHQLGYHLPALRRAPAGGLVAAAVAAAAAAVLLAAFGPYSSSLVTLGTDPELSNLAPPSVVLTLVGVAQVMLLAALWDAITRVLAHDRVWVAVAVVGARGMGIYLWHIPLVAAAAGLALATGWSVPPLSAAWWAVHLAVVAVVLPVAWLLAGAAAVPEQRAARLPRVWPLPALPAALAAGAVVLDLSVTGFATWHGPGMLGVPSATVPLLLALWLCWQSALRPRQPAP